MPHLVLEYSANVRDPLAPVALFAEVHAALAAAGGFRPQDFKSRAVRMDAYALGDGSREQSFANLDVRTFAGKSAQTKAAMAEAALAVLTSAFARTLRETACDLSVQITELERASYARVRSEDLPAAVPATPAA
ncbi:5-carboxymethyl-2-hydroxymuconate Delta-isomerase [Streptomyces sp. NPDC004244]|uniref:5-carboxymethyl-2-hydroxymuconate Delta-isomerase n=1 Tax=Streptomyces sp. NPDC101206 TaxID=3366128 RepID=UPI0038296A4F